MTETSDSASPTAEPANPSDRSMGMLAHLLSLTGWVVPLANILAPLVIWQTNREQSAYIARHAVESLNFQISVTIYAILLIPLCFVLIGIPLLIALPVFDLVFVILAAIRANDGKFYRYPLCLRMISG